MTIRRVLTAVTLAALATSALAAVSPEKRDWARGPVQYLLTKEEIAAWKALDSDAAADEFIALFWARRDPTPTTPRNEFHEEFDARVKFVDGQFTTPADKGWATDRGKAFIVFGQPLKVQRLQAEPTRPGANRPNADSALGRESEAVALRQVWTYEGPQVQKMFNIPHVEMKFMDRYANGDFRLEPGQVVISSAFQHVAAMNVTQPQLTKVPVYEAAAPVHVAAPVVPVPVVVEGIHTATLQAAVDALKDGKAAPSAAQFSHVEFIAPSGESFVPIALTVPASANVASTSVDTFFGEVRDAGGVKVASFEEPARPIAAKYGWFVDKTLNLGSGKYTAVTGLAKGGQPVLVTTAPFEAKVVTKDFIGVSKVMLWNDVVVLKDSLPLKSPYAFGTLQLVPNPSLAFTNQDELGYFIEISNPGIDPAANEPKLQMSIDLMADGKPISRQPLSEVQALALSGQPGPGQYAIVNSIPLPKLSKPLAPGEYTLKMRILDMVTKQSYTAQESFKITS